LIKRENREDHKVRREWWRNTWRFWASHLWSSYNTQGNK